MIQAAPPNTFWWYGYARSGRSRDRAGFFPADAVMPPRDQPLVIEVCSAHALPIDEAVLADADPSVRITLCK